MKHRGLAQIPLMIGLLLMAVALPVATKLVQDNQDNRNKAAGHCEYDDDCGSYGDYRCLEGECVKNAAPGGCSKDSDCPSGKTCMLGYCVTGTQTDECTKDSECNDDEHCIFSGGSDKCIKCTTFTYGACGTEGCASDEKPKKCGDNKTCEHFSSCSSTGPTATAVPTVTGGCNTSEVCVQASGLCSGTSRGERGICKGMTTGLFPQPYDGVCCKPAPTEVPPTAKPTQVLKNLCNPGDTCVMGTAGACSGGTTYGSVGVCQYSLLGVAQNGTCCKKNAPTIAPGATCSSSGGTCLTLDVRKTKECTALVFGKQFSDCKFGYEAYYDCCKTLVTKATPTAEPTIGCAEVGQSCATRSCCTGKGLECTDEGGLSYPVCVKSSSIPTLKPTIKPTTTTRPTSIPCAGTGQACSTRSCCTTANVCTDEGLSYPICVPRNNIPTYIPVPTIKCAKAGSSCTTLPCCEAYLDVCTDEGLSYPICVPRNQIPTNIPVPTMMPCAKSGSTCSSTLGCCSMSEKCTNGKCVAIAGPSVSPTGGVVLPYITSVPGKCPNSDPCTLPITIEKCAEQCCGTGYYYYNSEHKKYYCGSKPEPTGANPTNPPSECSGKIAPPDQCPVPGNPNQLGVNAACITLNGQKIWDWDLKNCDQKGRTSACGIKNYCCPSVGGNWTTDMTQCPVTCTQCAGKPEAKGKGDADCSGVTDINDASIWRSEFTSGQLGTEVSSTWRADFDCDGKVTLNDISIWRENFIKGLTN